MSRRIYSDEDLVPYRSTRQVVVAPASYGYGYDVASSRPPARSSRRSSRPSNRNASGRFREIYTKWGSFNTEKKVTTARYYLKYRFNNTNHKMHAVHPIPTQWLRKLLDRNEMQALLSTCTGELDILAKKDEPQGLYEAIRNTMYNVKEVLKKDYNRSVNLPEKHFGNDSSEEDGPRVGGATAGADWDSADEDYENSD
ncbi:hypothetical protein EJ04DRAFT_523760 [Polyplosphaeria fusca]|uniref:Uncharacterized protein n=1 Tax=Polyplosphaeria fusca TaxID=682080 RepID=A0A9P4QX83_9PLEO|nr:hypothetical protein EJ04DRAFT_523760 [Polyplosphaeria fusca]